MTKIKREMKKEKTKHIICASNGKREKEIERNFNIASKCYGRKRAKYAIYRLYRYCNVTPKQIAKRLSELNYCDDCFTTQEIWTIIAQVFANQCLKNKCAFRPFLKRIALKRAR